MKRLLLSLFFVGLANILMAQHIEFSLGTKTNRKAYTPKLIHIFPSTSDELVLVVEPKISALSRVKGINVRLCNRDWVDEKRIQIPNSRGAEIRGAFLNGNVLHIITSQVKTNQLILRHLSVDSRSLDIIADEEIMKVKKKYDNDYYWAASSPDGNYFGVVCSLKNRETKAMIFDKGMEKLWEQQLFHGEISGIFVSNDGTIFTAAIGNAKGVKDKDLLKVNMAYKDGERHGEFLVEEHLEQMTLLNSRDNKVLAVALENKRSNAIIIAGGKYTGVYTYVLDLEKGEISAAERHAFTESDIRTLENLSATSSVSNEKTDNVKMLGYCATPQGGAIMLQRIWMAERRNAMAGSTTSTSYHRKGILLMQIDMEGRSNCINSIMQNNQNATMVFGSAIVYHNNKLYVVTNESKDENDEYTPDIPAKSSKNHVFANYALAIYSFTNDGVGAKQMLERNEKTILMTPLYHAENGKYYFLAGAQHPRICSINIP